MPPNNKGSAKKVRCKWYNDVGYPRINPERQRRGWSPITGCLRPADRCWYAHPDHPDWKTAALSPYLQSKDYPDGRVPLTPEPPPTRKRNSRSKSPERRTFVKEEPRSPTLRYRSPDRHRSSSTALARRVGPRRSASPSRRERDRRAAGNNNGPSSRDYSRERGGYSYNRPPRKYSRERGEQEWATDRRNFDYARKDNDPEHDRGRRVSDSLQSNSSLNLSDPNRNNDTRATFQTPPQPAGSADTSGSVLSRLFDRDPGLGYTPKESTLQGLLTSLGLDSNISSSNSATCAQDTLQAPPSPPAPLPHQPHPSTPPPSPPHHPEPTPPVADSPRPHSRSSIASSISPPASAPQTSVAVPPDGVTSMATSSMSMLPPPTPASTVSATTLVAPLSAGSAASTDPYVVPPKPTFLNASQTPSNLKREELTREERAAIWEKRIGLLSEAIAAKRAYNERVADVKQLQALAAPDRTAGLPPSVRDQINTSLQSAEAQVNAAKECVKTFQQKVLELDFWPVRHPPDEYDPVKKDRFKTEQEEKEKQKRLVEDEQVEIKERISALSDSIFKLDKQMKEVALLVSARARSGGGGGGGPSASTLAPSEPAEMDWEPGEIRGTKRRKAGDDGAYMSDSASVTLGPLSPSLASGIPACTPDPLLSSSSSLRLRKLTHRLTKLESSYHDLENLFHQDEAQRQEELAALIDTHVERAREEILLNTSERQAERVKKLEGDIGQMDKEVQELVGEVTDLVESVVGMQGVQKKLEDERIVVEAERERIRAAIEENASRTLAMQAQLVANIQETQSLRQTLTLLSQSIPSSSLHTSAPPPQIPSIEDLVRALFPHLIKVIRTDIDQRLQEQKADLVKTIRENLHTFSGTQQQMDKVREMMERMAESPDVMNLLEGSGALSAVNGNGNGTTNGSGNGANAGFDGTVFQANGSAYPPKPPPSST